MSVKKRTTKGTNYTKKVLAVKFVLCVKLTFRILFSASSRSGVKCGGRSLERFNSAALDIGMVAP